MNRTVLATLMLAAVLVAGCGLSEKHLVGKWSGKMEVTDEMRQQDPSGMGEAMFANMTFDLELKDDKTFAMTMLFPLEGTWTLSESSVTLTVTKVMGIEDAERQQAQEPLVLTVAKDRQSMTGKLGQTDPNAPNVTFTRVES